MRVLVTGASGFVGSILIPRLLRDGHAVRALGRDPRRVRDAIAQAWRSELPAADSLEVQRADLLTGEGLARAMGSVEVAYYLIHSMERTTPNRGSFAKRDLHAAGTFASAAARAGVRRIVYLGGLLPRGATDGAGAARSRVALSPHLASREAVERLLLDALPGSVALRASIVIGARSRSFRLLVHLVERMPVLALPAWRSSRTQPIDARDVAEMLAAAADSALAGTLDVGGPDVLSYEQMITRIAELMLVRRPTLGLRVSLTALTARIAAAIAGEQPELVLPLMGSLDGDLLPVDDRAARLLNVELHTFDAAVERALADWEEYEPLAAR
jgi:uncharacterized protein YbjT (DUF2867 family)